MDASEPDSEDRNAGFLRDLARRAALAREPQPEGVRTPPARKLLAEVGEFVRRIAPPVSVDPAQCPQAVMVLPGFATHPRRMKPLFLALEEAGHRVEGWGLGYNWGPTEDKLDYLLKRVERFSEEQEEPVALVGWSLGGLFAREIARREPECVSKVVTMGTPFSGDLHANHAWRPYQAITGHTVDAPPIECDFSAKPPVPTIALWSPRDGVIHPRSAAGWPGERDKAVALRCTHLGFASRPEAVREVLKQIDCAD